MCSKSRVRVRRVPVRKPHAAQNGRDVDARLQALFPERQFLQVRQRIRNRGAVYSCVAQDSLARRNMMQDSVVGDSLVLFHRTERPRNGSRGSGILVLSALDVVPALVPEEHGRVVVLVKVLKDVGEGFGVLVAEVETLGGSAGHEVEVAAGLCEERRAREDFFVRGEEAVAGADADGYDGAGWRGLTPTTLLVHVVL